MDDERRVQPPEIREPEASFSIVEFYVNLGIPRPDLELFQMIFQYLELRPQREVGGLSVQYQPSSEEFDTPAMIVGHLLLGGDLGV